MKLFSFVNNYICVLVRHVIKTRFIEKIGILISVSLFACTSCTNAKANSPEVEPEELYGYYEFNENVFTTPLSSFLPFKGHMPFYEISEKGLSVISIRDNSVQTFPGTFEKKPIDLEQFKKMFEFTFLTPELDKYKECYEYAVFPVSNGPEYRLYLMDHEVWLVNVHTKGYLWSIYSLSRTEDVKSGPDGQLILPTEAPYDYQEGYQLELCSEKSVLEAVFVSDAESMKLLEELIELYEAQNEQTDNKDIFTISNYFRFYDATGKDNTLYYVFVNQAIAEQPQMQTNKGSMTRVSIPAESCEQLYQLLENLMPPVD